MDERPSLFLRCWLMTDGERFRALGLPGMLYASGQSGLTKVRYIIALEYDEYKESYYDGYDTKRRTARRKKYILYRVTHEVGRLCAVKEGEYQSFEEARSAAENACPGGDFSVSCLAAQHDGENDRQLAMGYLTYSGMPLEEFKRIEEFNAARLGMKPMSGCFTVLAILWLICLIILVGIGQFLGLC